MSAAGACRECENPLVHGDSELCAGCRNEHLGVCRWCGVRPPAAGSELCAECEHAAELVAETGCFPVGSQVGQPAAAQQRRAHRSPTSRRARGGRDGHTRPGRQQ
jgi:hypothetical protein